MSDYTAVSLIVSESTVYNQHGPIKTRLQLSIAARDDAGSEPGYRLAGPKYTGGSSTLVKVELDEEVVKKIRSYLAIWDGIQARKTAAADGQGDVATA